METATIDAISVKKELYKSKAMAKFSYYVGGSIYYTVELESGTYKFPMSTTDDVKLDDMPLKTKGEAMMQVDIELVNVYEAVEPIYVYDNDEEKFVEATCKKLSADLGTTEFFAEMRGSELNRWIAMAIKSGEFMKVD